MREAFLELKRIYKDSIIASIVQVGNKHSVRSGQILNEFYKHIDCSVTAYQSDNGRDVVRALIDKILGDLEEVWL